MLFSACTRFSAFAVRENSIPPLFPFPREATGEVESVD